MIFDVTTSYKLVCRVTLQETVIRSRYALTMRASERHASLPPGMCVVFEPEGAGVEVCSPTVKTAGELTAASTVVSGLDRCGPACAAAATARRFVIRNAVERLRPYTQTF
ncbi:hypothetical protein EVAR_63641_1 [Eumeta japonica]|uniref:Uncharacterized protein n=1 Tax=Eumeta variegata TaxID=151549 RepID=A0A4C2A255_EUMVA|nr:hypothetical protein EVAR_63641_1 [Eumeta japonica]